MHRQSALSTASLGPWQSQKLCQRYNAGEINQYQIIAEEANSQSASRRLGQQRLSDIGNRTNPRPKISSGSGQDRVHPLLPAHGIEQEYWICLSSNDRVISSVQQVLILGARHEIHSIHLASHRPILISDLSSFASFASSEFQRRKLSR